jgi:aryl-alcohol dehydrogenase-like predicted oxidoreductase
MLRLSRRDFFKTSIAVVAGGAIGSAAVKRAATDWVTLGNSGVKVTRLAFGTGTFGGRVQRELGQEQFTRLVRHAYDSGIRFFETADNYKGMPQMLAAALKGIPRDSYRLMTKYRWRTPGDAQPTLDRFRKDLNSEYFDIVLLHNVHSPTWPVELERLRDQFSEAKHRKVLLAHGASCHGLKPLRAFPGTKWLDVALLRVNHNGTRMDNEDDIGDQVGDVRAVTAQVKLIHQQGTGVLGMKLVGEGQFTNAEDREASLRYVFGSGAVDAVTIGYKSSAEIDEAIARVNQALNQNA